MSRFGLIAKRVERPDISKLELYKKIYLNNKIDVAIWGDKYGQGVWCYVFETDRWYKLDYRLPGMVK